MRSIVLGGVVGGITKRAETLDDAVDEDEEVFALVLTNPSGVKIGDGTATGTIANSDALQAQWLARFGRTVAHQVVDAIGERLERSGRTHITVVGRELGAERAKGGGESVWTDIEDEAKPETLSADEAMLRSAFRLSSDAGDGTGRAWTAWDRMARSRFFSTDDDLTLSGNVTSALLGVDAERGHWLAGVALAHNRGDGSHRHAGDAQTSIGGGEVGTTLTSIHPYVRRRIGDDLGVWGIAGYGTGTLTLDDRCRGGADAETDVEMSMAAAGVCGKLLELTAPGALRLGLRSDFTRSQIGFDFATGTNCGNLAAAEVRTSRTRLVMNGAATLDLDAGDTFTPSVEIGLRRDGGTPRRGSVSRRAPACTSGTRPPASPAKPACGGSSSTRTTGTWNGARARR